MSSYTSQFGQDKWIVEEMFPNMTQGYFVDLAAGDGIFLSNTYVLEKQLCWKGLCIEPNSTSYKKLQANRSCSVDDSVVMQDGFEVDFIEYKTITDYEHLLSAANGTSTAPFPVDNITKRVAVSLHTLLDKHNAPETINYISMDIEGSEVYVLQDFLPKNRRKILTWSIESNPGDQHSETIKEWMIAYGYELLDRGGLDGRQGHDYFFRLKQQ